MVNIDRDKLIGHINNLEDKEEIKRVIDKVEIVLNRYLITSTDFLNPHELNLAISVLNRFKNEVSFEIDGGYYGAENCIIYLYPHYELNIPKRDIDIFKFDSNSTIKHSDVLGSLLGLGIERKKIGDILIGKKYTYFFVKNEISNFIEISLNKISKYNISLERVEKISTLPKKEYIYKNIFVASPRIDNIVSSFCNVSRSVAKDKIKSGDVKVNFAVEYRPHFEVNAKDLISVRKFGRFRIEEFKRKTKKGNIVLSIKYNK